MKFQMIHENYNVADLSRSLAFYEEALGLTEKRRITADDGSFIIVYVGNETTDFELELTWLRDREEPYNLGDNEFHLAFRTDNFEESHSLHEKMGCICFENHDMGGGCSRQMIPNAWERYPIFQGLLHQVKPLMRSPFIE